MHTINNSLKSRGFTLVELMVVVTIIAMLSAVLYGSFNQARQQARDKARMTGLKELQLAIEMYKAQYGRYPEAGCSRGIEWVGPGTHPSWGNTTHCPTYIVGLTPDFISTLPTDPLSEMTVGWGMLYKTNAAGTVYKIMVHGSVESLFIQSYEDEFARCPYDCGQSFCSASGPQGTVYAAYSLGAQCW